MKNFFSSLASFFKSTPKPTPTTPPPKEDLLLDGYLTKHFKLSEFTNSATAKAKGISNDPGPQQIENLKKLAATLEQVRTLLGNNPILISSGYRSRALNTLVGGSATSDHANGLAVDFTCPRYGSAQEVCQAIAGSNLEFDQIIYEQGNTEWVHFGIGMRMRKQTLSWSPAKGYVSGIKKLS